jgi:hypothetical protein
MARRRTRARAERHAELELPGVAHPHRQRHAEAPRDAVAVGGLVQTAAARLDRGAEGATEPEGLVIGLDQKADLRAQADDRERVAFRTGGVRATLQRRDGRGQAADAHPDAQLAVPGGVPRARVQAPDGDDAASGRGVPLRSGEREALEVCEHPDAERSELKEAARGVEKRRGVDADAAAVVEIGLAERTRQRHADREIVVEVRGGLRRTDGRSGDVGPERVDAVGKRGVGASEARGAEGREHRALVHVDDEVVAADARQAGGGDPASLGARLRRDRQRPDHERRRRNERAVPPCRGAPPHRGPRGARRRCRGAS